MGTQYETVTVTIGGANPQTIPVTVPVNVATGSGTATLTYTGVNGGSDSLQGTATIAGTAYTSNSAQVNWQQSNGSIQVGSVVTCYAWGDSPQSGGVASYIWCNPNDSVGISHGAISRPISGASFTQTNNSLAFDAYITGTDGAEPLWSTFNAVGSATGSISFPPYTENFNCVVSSFLLVPAPGSYTLTFTYKDGAMWGIGPSATGAVPTWSGMGTYTGVQGQTMTVGGGYPLLYSPGLSSGEGGYINTITQVVTFPQAGVYPLENDWDYWYHSGRIFHVTSSAGELAPVTLIGAPPSSTPSGNLTITPAGGPTNLQVTGQSITLSVNVSGIVYPTISYCPVFQGTAGEVYLYNSPTSPTFTFQTYNEHAVDNTAAAANVFALSSFDNTAYQGLFSVGYASGNFTLNYNGNTANPSSTSRVASTSLVVEAEDIAWFNSSTNSFDVFQISGTTGGNSYNIEINYMNSPTVSSISPTTIAANGGSYTLSISLNQAFSPQQQGALNTGNTVNCVCSIVGAQSTGSPSPNLDSGGWLTGWNVPFTAPVATTNQTLTVDLTVSGVLTYLNGSSFVTNTVYYIGSSGSPATIGTITAGGTSYSNPVAYSFSVSPPGPSYPTNPTLTLTGQVFVPGSNDSVSLTFFSQSVSTSTKSTINVGTLLSSNPATVGGVSGFLQTFTALAFASAIGALSQSYYLGFNATDNVSGLTCSYTTSVSYSWS